jgi:hypothetical protein
LGCRPDRFAQVFGAVGSIFRRHDVPPPADPRQLMFAF